MRRHKLRGLLVVPVIVAVSMVVATSCSTDERQVRTGASTLEEDDRVRKNNDEDGQFHIGANAEVDLAIFFKPGVTDADIASFISDTLNKPLEGARFGKDLLPGMQSTLADYDRRAVFVGFFDNATPKERLAVKQTALASALVDRVEEGIVPAQKYPRP